MFLHLTEYDLGFKLETDFKAVGGKKVDLNETLELLKLSVLKLLWDFIDQ